MRIKPDAKLREIAGEKMVVMSGPVGVDFTKVVMLNKTAERLWKSLQSIDFQEDDVVILLQKEYGISRDQAAKDAKEWIESMLNVGLIEN